ncbi:unnamed protein product, partial [Effrenium voratum]
DFNLLTAGVGPLVNQTRRTLHKSSSCLARFAHLEREQAESRALDLANGFLKDLSKPEGLKRLSQVWAQFSAEDLSLLFPTAARRLGSADFSIAALVKPLTSSLASPMARISSIFLLQLQNIGRSTGFHPMEEQQLCSWQMPSACTNLGLSFFSLVLLQLLIIGGVLSLGMKRFA